MKTTKSASDKALSAVRSTMKPASLARVDAAIAARGEKSATRKAKAAAATGWRTSPEAVSCIAATVTEPGIAEAIVITEQRAAESSAALPPATVEAPALPVVTPGATHFRLTRKFIEVASDVRHYEADLAALGYRDGDKIEFGTMTATGSFTTSARALREPNAPKSNRSKVITKEALALAETMIREGVHTSKEIAIAVLAQFPGDEKKTQREVGRLGRNLTKSGALTGPAFVKAIRTVKIKATKEEKVAARAAARAAMEYGV